MAVVKGTDHHAVHGLLVGFWDRGLCFCLQLPPGVYEGEC